MARPISGRMVATQVLSPDTRSKRAVRAAMAVVVVLRLFERLGMGFSLW
jgi:hypothetical protein